MLKSKLNASVAGLVTLTALFLVLSMFVIFLRTGWIIYFETSGKLLSEPDLFGCTSELRPCTRVLTSVLARLSEYLAIGVSKFLFWDIMDSAFFSMAPDAVIQVNERISIHSFRNFTVPFIGRLIFITLCLSSLYFFVLKYSRSAITRHLLMIVLLYAVLGWHPVLVNAYFNLMTNFIEWPQYYFLFSEPYKNSDFSSIAFLIFAVYFLASDRHGKLIQVALIALIAQATFEYLGMLFMIAIFLYSFFDASGGSISPRIYRSLKLTAVAGIGVAISLILIVFARHLSGLSLMYDVNSSSTLNLAQLISPAFNQRLAINLESWKILLAILLTMVSLPAIAGLVAGAASAILTRGKSPMSDLDAVKLAKASLYLGIGFLMILVTGIFFIHYPAEMGRQLMPLAVITVVPFFVTGDLATRKLFRFSS